MDRCMNKNKRRQRKTMNKECRETQAKYTDIDDQMRNR